MSIKLVEPKLNQNYSVNTTPRNKNSFGHNQSQVSFQGVPASALKAPNFIVRMMEFIAAGGFAASFIIQDGIGFIAPRVGKGLFRGGKEKKDENGNVILDKNGNPKHELNWAYARKEGLREVITGPSAFIIPALALIGINKKFGTGNSVKLDYIDGFQNNFAKFAQNNTQQILNGKADKKTFYEDTFKEILENTINSDPKAIKMTPEEIEKTAQEFAQRQMKYDDVLADRSISRFAFKRKKEADKRVGTIEDDFMQLKKQRIGGNVNEMAAMFKSSDGRIKAGGIKEITTAMNNYFGDAVNNVKKALEHDANANIEDIVKHFTGRRMGSRILTNLGLFLTVALFYTQIPKLYNMGLKGNPALGEDNSMPALQKNEGKKDVNFTGNMASVIEKNAKRVFNNKTAKSISDVFELDGPIIQGSAMSVLLYLFCIPPRLWNAQDKYDYKEIVVRDLTAFTALLFGAKALSRLFSDGFTKVTGLALNSKNLEGRNFFQKFGDYMHPGEGHHSVLSSKQLNSKYTNLHEDKDGVIGFMDFIESSKGNIKKAFAQDKNAVSVIEKILGKSYASSTVDEIKNALSNAHKNNTKEIQEFYKIFMKENGLLNKAKTCNSFFGALSTLALVPGLIIGLTDYCKHMTEKQKAKDDAEKLANLSFTLQAPVTPSNKPTMAGFLNG